jgi:hypothetical protein
MSTDFSATPDDKPNNSEADSPMFAPVPAWERGKKRRGLGGGRTRRVAEEPRSFASDPDERAPLAARESMVREPTWPAPDAIAPDGIVYERLEEPADGVFAGTPVYAEAASRKGAIAPVAIAAGIILLGGVAAAGWYFTQSHSTGLAQLTPGQAVTTTTTVAPATTAPAASAPLAPTPEVTPTAPRAPATAAASPTNATTTTAHESAATAPHHALAPRAAPVSRSAGDTAADASATLPAAPQPYQGQATSPAPNAAAATTPEPATATPAAPATSPAPPQASQPPPQ